MSGAMTITLAFDSAIAGGSISLLEGVNEIDHWIGNSDVSRAEDLLINIDMLLANNDLSRRDIALIAVSAGPGSFTGIRIGLATGLGLKNGLGVSMASVSAMQAIAEMTVGESICVVMPMGRSSVCLQQFTNRRVSAPPYVLGLDEFKQVVHANTNNQYVVHEKLFTTDLELSNAVNFDPNIAKAIGLFAINYPTSATEPLFISKLAQ